VAIVVVTTLLIYPVIQRLLTRLADLSEQLLDANLATLSLLGAAIAKRDSDTDAHNYRVTLYSLHLGEAAGLADADMQALLKGAFLHDVGKIGIRDAVLLKPARLTAEEFDVMRTHVDHGLEMVRRSAWLADAAQVVGSHHEKVDGSGYPSGKRWDEIPIAARIFAIVDVFDALTSRRPYKEPLAFDEAVELLRQGRDTHFDGTLLDRFLAIAPDLYQRYGGREDQGIKDELGELARRQFSPESLVS
jgi:putative nucleotidyltransferase with HDIG domain